jgi:hypothetical protein
MAVLWILALPNPQFNDAHDAAQMHRLTSPMPGLATAQGENSAVAAGFGLEFLFKPLAHPFAAFG